MLINADNQSIVDQQKKTNSQLFATNLEGILSSMIGGQFEPLMTIWQPL